MIKNIKELLYIGLGLSAYYLLISMLHTTCILKWFTGISCGGCGMSRAFLSLLKGDYVMAYKYHPLIYVMPIAVIIFIFRDSLNNKTQHILLALFIVLFMIVYIKRMLDPNDLVVVANINDSIIIRGINNVLSKLR